MDELLALARKHGLAVIEDCAHANGAVYRGRKAGTIGNMSCWSLQQDMVFTAAGEGGMLATNDEGLARTARSVCDHGKDKAAQTAGELEYSIVRVGNNYRLSEIQAAFAVAQLRKAAVVQEARKAHSEYLDSGLGQVPGLRRPSPPPDVRPGHPTTRCGSTRTRSSSELTGSPTPSTQKGSGPQRLLRRSSAPCMRYSRRTAGRPSSRCVVRRLSFTPAPAP